MKPATPQLAQQMKRVTAYPKLVKIIKEYLKSGEDMAGHATLPDIDSDARALLKELGE